MCSILIKMSLAICAFMCMIYTIHKCSYNHKSGLGLQIREQIHNNKKIEQSSIFSPLLLYTEIFLNIKIHQNFAMRTKWYSILVEDKFLS